MKIARNSRDLIEISICETHEAGYIFFIILKNKFILKNLQQTIVSQLYGSVMIEKYAL